MRNKIRRSMILFFAFLFVCPAKPVRAADVVCKIPSVESSILKDVGGYELLLVVENKTSSQIDLIGFFFGENMLHLRATQVLGGVELRQVIPLLSPGVRDVIIAPGGRFVRKIKLDTIFPGLGGALGKGDVRVSWELQVRPHNSCYIQKVATTITINKTKAEKRGAI